MQYSTKNRGCWARPKPGTPRSRPQPRGQADPVPPRQILTPPGQLPPPRAQHPPGSGLSAARSQPRWFCSLPDFFYFYLFLYFFYLSLFPPGMRVGATVGLVKKRQLSAFTQTVTFQNKLYKDSNFKVNQSSRPGSGAKTCTWNLKWELIKLSYFFPFLVW